jgi:hypothetical protein
MAKTRRSAPSERPTFVFHGTITRLRAATMRQAPVDARTAVVHVDAVIEAPADMTKLAGQDVTVQLAAGARPAKGRSLVFHTVPLMFGDSVLVKSLAQEPVTLTRAALATVNPVARKAARDVRERVADADMVVSGHVVSINLPESERAGVAAPRSALARSATERPRPVSEHDPKWREAVVEVDAVHKGPSARTVSVRFPASTDVRWYKAPKFTVGQRGFFMLRRAGGEPTAGRAAPSARARALARQAAPGPVYTALHPADFQPLTDTHVVDAAAAAAPAARPKPRARRGR